ncbi:MAG: LysM domain-containing protein [Candidatus Binatia bacterium]
MEGEITSVQLKKSLRVLFGLWLGISFPTFLHSQEAPLTRQEEETVQLKLRKTVKTRQYQGRAVEGEERIISPGESLWRILIQEKGLSAKRFDRYLVVVRSLNPHLRNPDVLQVGDTIFIPLGPDEILGIQVSAKEGTKLYRVKQGDNLYTILQREFEIRKKRVMESAYNRVKVLNPRKQNWNLLFVGEPIVLPGQLQALRAVATHPQVEVPKVSSGKQQAEAPQLTTEPRQVETPQDNSGEREVITPQVVAEKPASQIGGLDYGLRLPAHGNLALLEQVMKALRIEIHHGGEEVFSYRGGTVHIDLDSYPVMQNPDMKRRLILDLEGRIPRSLQAKLNADGSAVPIVSMKTGDSFHAAVNRLLPRLGFQSLPSEQPVVIQDKGVGLQVKGEWMVIPPEQSSGRHEIIVINLTDIPEKTPDYLRDYLSLKGMKLNEVLLPAASRSPPSRSRAREERQGQFEVWPHDKKALVDAFLQAYQISFSKDHPISVFLQEGIRLDTKLDRFFEFEGKSIGLLFHPFGDEAKAMIQKKEGVRAIDLDLQSLSSRELILRLSGTIGESAFYQENHFPATDGGTNNKLVLSVPGFLLRGGSLFLTDREIPKDLRRFFAEKGVQVGYFQ